MIPDLPVNYLKKGENEPRELQPIHQQDIILHSRRADQ